MLSSLKDHPFAVEAFFNYSLVLTYAVPKEELAHLIPECLTLDCYEEKWAFIAVAMVDTTGLRPKGFPAMAGNDFFLIGYRIFVRYTNNAGKRLRGLYIIKSETDKKKMELLGNIFTHYSYTTTDIRHSLINNKIGITSLQSGLEVIATIGDETTALPQGSPFPSWREARKFAGPLPFTFTFDAAKSKVLIVEGVRQNWIPTPVDVGNVRVGFIDSLQLRNPSLANAFIIRNIPYYWKKGRTEVWTK